MAGNYNFYPKKRSFLNYFSVTFILIMINVFAFLFFTILLATGLISVDFVALKPSNVFQGNYLWTFATSMFMHAGFFHLFANMFSMVFLGSLVEKILGPKRYTYFYLLSGLLAGAFFVLASLVFSSDLNAFAVGASGAIFGLVGLLVLLTPNLPVYVMFIPIPIKMKYAGPGLLALLWLISLAGSIPIGNTAHFGGLLAGIFYGIYLRNRYRRKTKYLSRYFS